MTNVSPTATTLSTSGTSLAPASSALSTSGTTFNNPSNNLGENDFLTLMMDQLKNQDPTSPSDPTQYLSELANFSSLEQETHIAQTSSSAANQQATSSALGLLGHTVSYSDSQGQPQSGTVTKVDFTSSGPTLTIGAIGGITLGSVTEAS